VKQHATPLEEATKAWSAMSHLERQEYNRLIAAAPDLLHALDCILWRHMEDEFIPTEFWDMAKEAVKKAKGA
jgi:hypothetical protein